MFESPFGFNPSQSFKAGFQPSNSKLPTSSVPKGTISQSSDYSNWQDTGIVPVSKNTIQSMTRPNYVQSKKYPQATVEQEQFIEQQAGGDKYKAMEEYDKFLQTKKSKEFLDMRKEQVTNLMEEKVNTKDENKRKQIDTLIKGSMLADFAREQALKGGVLDVYSKSDNDIYAGLITQPEHEQAFADYLNGDKNLDDVVNVLTPGYNIQKEEPQQEQKGFIGQTVEDIKSRLGNVVDLIGNVKGQDVADAGGVSNYVSQKLLRIGGQVAGGVNDVVGNLLNSLIQSSGADKPLGEALNKVLNTDIGKKGIELYSQGADAFANFEAVHPETAQSIKDVWQIAQAIPTIGVVKAGVNAAGNVVSKVRLPKGSITEGIAQKVTGTVSNEDKLFKAASPSLNILTKNRDIKAIKGDFDIANSKILDEGYMPVDTSTRRIAHEGTMQKTWDKIQSQIDNKADLMVDQTPIASKIEEFIQEAKKSGIVKNQPDIKALEKEALQMRKNPLIDLPRLEKKKQFINGVINNWGDSNIGDVYKNGMKEATKIIGQLEDGILSKIPGQFSEEKKVFGSLKATYEDVLKADIKNLKSQGLGLIESYSRIEGFGDILGGLASIVTRGSAGVADVAKGVGKTILGKSLQKAKDPNFLIKEGFEGLSKKVKVPLKAIEKPMALPYKQGIPKPKVEADMIGTPYGRVVVKEKFNDITPIPKTPVAKVKPKSSISPKDKIDTKGLKKKSIPVEEGLKKTETTNNPMQPKGLPTKSMDIVLEKKKSVGGQDMYDITSKGAKKGELEVFPDYMGKNDIYINYIGVNESERGMGIAKDTLNKILDKYPNAKTISAEPTNKIAFDMNIKVFGKPIEISDDISELSLKEARNRLPDKAQYNKQGELDSSNRVFVRFDKPKKIESQIPIKSEKGTIIDSNSSIKTKDMQDLYTEARKYKSAEEFVKAQGEPTYHGTSKKREGEFKEPVKGEYGSEAIFLAKDEGVANYYNRSGNGGEIKKAFITPDAKIWDYNNPKDIKLVNDFLDNNKEFNKYIKDNYVISNSEVKDLIAKGNYGWIQKPQVMELLRSKGYDGFKNMDYNGESIGVFSNKSVKTESQLRKIREEANKK